MTEENRDRMMELCRRTDRETDPKATRPLDRRFDRTDPKKNPGTEKLRKVVGLDSSSDEIMFGFAVDPSVYRAG
jgi:hypothetical protein